MSNKGSFEIECKGCKKPVQFSLFDLDEKALVECHECGKKYGFSDETLKRQLKKFANLCRQIQESEEILGKASVAVTLGKEEVKVPFKLLLTRLKSTLDLQIGNERISISFRVEPAALKNGV